MLLVAGLALVAAVVIASCSGPSLSSADRRLVGDAVHVFLERDSTDTSKTVCAEHLVEVRHVAEQLHVAAWASCRYFSLPYTDGEAGGSSGPVLITGPVRAGRFVPSAMEAPGDGDQYASDIRRLFSKAAAAELLGHPDYGLDEKVETAARAVR